MYTAPWKTYSIYFPKYKVKLYADDTNLFLCDTDANNLNIKANTSLKELNTWLKINKLSLNIEKKCYMLFSSRGGATDIKMVRQNRGAAGTRIEVQ